MHKKNLLLISLLALMGVILFQNCGKTSTPDLDQSELPVVLTGPVTNISVSNAVTCAVRSGYVKCWGKNNYGQLGIGETTSSLTPKLVKGISDINKVDTNGSTTCALSSSERLYCWGLLKTSNIHEKSYSETPSLVNLLNVTDFSVGRSGQICAVSSGQVYCWGRALYFLPLEDTHLNALNPYTNVPTLISGLTGIVSIVAGFETNCANSLTRLYCWGGNQYGQFGDGASGNIINLTPVDLWSYWSPYQFSMTGSTLCNVASSGGLTCAGRNISGYNVPTTSNLTSPISPLSLSSADYVSTGANHACAITGSNTIKCWGWNDSYQLGINSTSNATRPPTEVYGIDQNIIALSAGDNSTCASFVDETMRCWGENKEGQLGNGNKLNQSVPVQVLDI